MSTQVVDWKQELQERLCNEVVVQCLIDVCANETNIRILSADAVYVGNVFLLEYRWHSSKADLEIREGELAYKFSKGDGERVEIKRLSSPWVPGHPFLLCGDQFLSIVGESLTLAELGREKGFDIRRAARHYAYRRLMGSQHDISINSPQLVAHYGRLHERIYCEMVMGPKPQGDLYPWSAKMENLILIHRRFGAFVRDRQVTWSQVL